MKYFKHILFAVSFCSIIFLVRRSSADYLGDMKASLQKMQEYLSMLSDKAGKPIKKFAQKVVALKNTASAVYKKKIFKHEDNYAIATVRFGDELSVGEQEYVLQRRPKICAALHTLYGKQCDDAHRPPVISIVASGGGYRAMLGTIGFLSGIEQIGLLDTITYIAALSGSTWAVLPWIATGMSLPDFRDYITQSITHDINDSTTKESNLITKMLFKKVAGASPVTSVDIYGGMLANRLLYFFEDKRQSVCLSDVGERMKTGEWAYPICTAIDARSAVAHDAPWFEFTPHEIGCAEFGVYIPTWGYGRKFRGGTSTSFRPELTLGFQLGTYGSAFGVHIGLAWKTIESTIADSWFKDFMNATVIQYEGKRLFWADVHNFMAGIPGNPFEDRRYLKLVDAGLAFNLPYPPVSGERLGRKSDILIFCNMSADHGADALMKCEEYARNRDLPFPKIDYEGISERTISIFKDEDDRSLPVVIYMPRLSDHALFNEKKTDLAYRKYKNIENFDIDQCIATGFCKTKNFKYTQEQSAQVIDQMEFNVVANKEKILEAIRWVVERE